MMSKNKLLLRNKHKRNRRLLSPKARRLSSRMERVATKVVTRRASRKSMTVPRLLVELVVESAAEAEAVAVAVAVTAVMVSAAVAVAKVAVVVAVAAMASAVVVAKVAAVPVAGTVKAVVVVAVKVAVVKVAVVKVAVEAVDVVVPELPRLPVKVRLRLKELSVADSAIVSKERLARKLIHSIDRMEPAELAAVSARVDAEEVEIDLAEKMPLLLVKIKNSRILPLPPKRRPRRLLALSLRNQRKKLASLLMTTWSRSRPNPRVCSHKLKQESTRR